MGIETAVAIAGVAASAAGTAVAYQGQQEAADASSAQVAAERRAEAARKKQADLEHSREKRKAIRNAIIARSDVLSGIIGRGIGTGSSAIGGGLGAVTAESGQQIGDINQNQQITGDIFRAREEAAQAGDAFSRARATTATGGAISSLGSTILTSFDPIVRVGETVSGRASQGTLGWSTQVNRG